jgi:hypothetical protein
MLFSLRSIVLFPWLRAASLPVVGVGAVPVPSDPAEPVVTPGAVLAPDDCAVPALFVPGAVAAPGELAAPCELAALPPPAAAPLALWAREMAGKIMIAATALATMADVRIIEILLFDLTAAPCAGSGNYPLHRSLKPPRMPAPELIACAN